MLLLFPYLHGINEEQWALIDNNFVSEEVTKSRSQEGKDKYQIHAWGLGKAKEYVDIIIKEFELIIKR